MGRVASMPASAQTAQRPQALGLPLQAGGSWLSCAAANTESFFTSFGDWQCGHLVPFQRVDRTSTSLSLLQDSQ